MNQYVKITFRKLFFLLMVGLWQFSFFLVAHKGFSQETGVSIGDTLKPAHPSAILELFSSGKGFLPPRMSTVEIDSIANPATGLIVYDTDRQSLLYYQNGWKSLGMWIPLDDDKIAYTGGSVFVADTSVQFDFGDEDYLLNVVGTKGILSHTEGDTVPLNSMPVSNVFLGNFTNNTGGYMNTLISSDVNGTEESLVAGLAIWTNNNGQMTAGMTSESYYTGAGAESIEDENIPFAGALMGSVEVEDDEAVVMAVGSYLAAKSNHKGVNLGVMAGVASATTYANIGVVSMVNIEGEESSHLEDVFMNFPERVSIASLVYNDNSDSVDFNIYASGDAQSYFEGRVGIGTLNPQSMLDIAGGVNASVYLVNGDTLALNSAWSQSGNDIYYSGGNVHIGKIIPASSANLNITGSLMAVSDTALSFPFSCLTVVKDNSPGINIFMLDTLSRGGNLDTTYMGFGIGKKDNVLNSAWTYFSDSLHNRISIGGLDVNEQQTNGIYIASGVNLSDNVPSLPKTIIQANSSNLIIHNNSPFAESSLLMNDGSTRFYNGKIAKRTELSSDSVRFNLTVVDTDTAMNFSVTKSGIGINTFSPDTELHVAGSIKQSVYTEEISNPPTETELNNLFTSAASKGAGWTVYLQDDDSDNFYQIVASGGKWYVVSLSPAD